jgi:2-polyprenyl-3-methyl-5-hydroxy-6-metoxy-1,4-benzoquinol methylase
MVFGWMTALFSNRIRNRREMLARQLATATTFEELEESCVPSYLHKNRLAAWVAWGRLKAAADLFRQYCNGGRILDFGSSTGELFFLLDEHIDYHFVESNEKLCHFLKHNIPNAHQRSIENLEEQEFDAIFCLDSLEHNRDIAGIVRKLFSALKSSGCLIVSGPTENLMYRLGRKIAGFSGHYHETNVYEIERIISTDGSCERRVRFPYGIPIFSITVWRHKT